MVVHTLKVVPSSIYPLEGRQAGLFAAEMRTSALIRSRAGGRLRHILVVDDHAMVCMAIEIYLQRHNFRVTIADGGEAGLRALENEQFDLMIIDIFMPHMRGFESIRIFRERAPAVPLIAMSGYAFANLNSPAPDFLRMALELGASRCLRKPFTPAALQVAIEDCLAEQRAAAVRLG